MRNNYIDYIRGLAALSVLWIHTVGWSGASYVAPYMQQLCLLIDVPIFFFVAGWSYGYTNDMVKGMKNILRLQIRYMVFIVLYAGLLLCFRDKVGISQIVAWLLHLNYDTTKHFPVAIATMWFMRVFIATSMIGYIALKIKRPYVMLLISFLLTVLCSYAFWHDQTSNTSIFDFRYIPIYLTFYLAGYITKDREISWKQLILGMSAVILGLLALYDCHINVFNIVKQKFPPTIVYMLWSIPSLLFVIKFKKIDKMPCNKYINRIGRYSIHYYFAQGISSSILYFVVPFYRTLWWPIALVISFTINVILYIPIAEFLIGLERGIMKLPGLIHHLKVKLTPISQG